MLEITKEEVKSVLNKVFICVENGNFIISQGHNRLENRKFINDYRLTDERQREMIKSLDVYDFSKIDKDRNNNYEILYFFGKEYELNHIERGLENKEVYIKFTIKSTKTREMIVFISFHQVNYPIQYYFSK